MAARRSFVPGAAVQFAAGGKAARQQHDDFAEREFGYGAAVAVGIVEDGYAARSARCAVDLIDSDAECADGEQGGSRFEHRVGDSGLGADAEHNNIAQLFAELSLVQGCR